MRRHGICLVLVLLAGCGASNSGDTPEAVCRRQAYDDPTVKHLTVENLGASAPNPGADFDYNKALRDATDACLRQKGIQVRGGVEPVRP
jgi:hypothetical protein